MRALAAILPEGSGYERGTQAYSSPRDLPPGLRFDPTWDTYHYRGTRAGERLYVPFGKIGREAAIKAYWKIVGPQKDEPAAGTVGELIDRYLHDEVPRGDCESAR